MPIGQEQFRRSYSLCTSPYTDVLPAITIKRVPGGRISNYLNDYVQAGHKIEVLPAAGNFSTSYLTEQARNLVFIGGGSGITPLFSMLKAALHQAPESRVLLKRGILGIYHSTSRKHLQMYVDEFAFRYNTRHNCEISRFNLLLANTEHRLTYKELING